MFFQKGATIYLHKIVSRNYNNPYLFLNRWLVPETGRDSCKRQVAEIICTKPVCTLKPQDVVGTNSPQLALSMCSVTAITKMK